MGKGGEEENIFKEVASMWDDQCCLRWRHSRVETRRRLSGVLCGKRRDGRFALIAGRGQRRCDYPRIFWPSQVHPRGASSRLVMRRIFVPLGSI